MDLKVFQETVWNYYRTHGRNLPWRRPKTSGNLDAYKVLVSEIMLQQTQVSRVIPKYEEFLKSFPTPQILANSSLGEILKVWNGLGYNRRAKYLHEAAKKLATNSRWNLEDLTNCKGIGYNTAAAILTYAHNQPTVFIETNIRTVFIHHFFAGQKNISDKQLLPFVKQALDYKQPREWHWALMDYGSYLKSHIGNAAQRSKHYTKQSAFVGSTRQIRGQVVRLLAEKSQDKQQLERAISDNRLSQVLADLMHEGLIAKHEHTYRLF